MQVVPIEEDQHYESRRGWLYTIVFENDDVLLMFDGENYRLEPREQFESDRDAGFYEHKPDVQIYDSNSEIPLQEIPLIGEVAEESLVQAGYTTPSDFQRGSEEAILDCRGVGESGLENIFEFMREEMEVDV